MTKNLNYFRCYSRNLNEFLKATGIKPKSKGVHTTGLGISKDSGITWSDFTNVYDALEKFPKYSQEQLEGLRDKSFSVGKPVEVSDTDKTLVRKRVRYFQVYEQDDKLQYALEKWKETGPNKYK